MRQEACVDVNDSVTVISLKKL